MVLNTFIFISPMQPLQGKAASLYTICLYSLLQSRQSPHHVQACKQGGVDGKSYIKNAAKQDT